MVQYEGQRNPFLKSLSLFHDISHSIPVINIYHQEIIILPFQRLPSSFRYTTKVSKPIKEIIL